MTYFCKLMRWNWTQHVDGPWWSWFDWESWGINLIFHYQIWLSTKKIILFPLTLISQLLQTSRISTTGFTGPIGCNRSPASIAFCVCRGSVQTLFWHMVRHSVASHLWSEVYWKAYGCVDTYPLVNSHNYWKSPHFHGSIIYKWIILHSNVTFLEGHSCLHGAPPDPSECPWRPWRLLPSRPDSQAPSPWMESYWYKHLVISSLPLL